jgi:hypothetical protein
MLRYVRKNLQSRRGDWPDIAKKANVSYSWVTHVMQGKTPNPRIIQVQSVYNVLYDMQNQLPNVWKKDA